MRKAVLIVLGALMVVSVATSVVLYQRYQSATAAASAVGVSERDAQQRYGDALSAIAEIQDSLSTLGVDSMARPVVPGSPATERGLSMERGRDALDRIAQLKAGIRRTRERLATLESTIHRNGVQVAGLAHLIDNLKRTLGEKEELVALLSGQVDSLHVQVTGLTTEVAQAQDTIHVQVTKLEDQRRELGTVYYMMGSKRSLARAGLVEAKGGVLGLGKTLVPTAHVDEHLFTALDTDAQAVIVIPSAKARVLTAQPASSYALQPAGNGMELRILDPRGFRTVRHLVIVTS